MLSQLQVRWGQVELEQEKQTRLPYDAIQQYQNDRDPWEKLFAKVRCLARFALNDS